MFASDQEIFSFVKEHLYVAAVCDMLDTLGYRHQAMHQRLRPLLPNIKECGFIGRARTVRWMETNYVVEEDPYGQEIDAMDALCPGDVVVYSSDYAGTSGLWGELMSTVARRNGAAGCICDGNIRDTVKIIEMGFPVYYAGIQPLDSKGRARVMAFDVPVRCGEVLVYPHDLVFADYDGIVVIPQAVEQQVLQLANEKVGAESVTRQELLSGSTLRDVYNKYGIL